MNDDIKHLGLLSVFHYVIGGLSGFFSCMFIIHIVIGVVMLMYPELMTDDNGEGPPAFMGYLFTIIGSIFFLVGMAFSACVIYSGRLLKQQKKHLFSFVVACILCIFVPFGTILGVFTIIVLSRDSVKKLYAAETSD